MKSLTQISALHGISINVLHYRTKAHGILPTVIGNIRYFDEHQIELLLMAPEKPDIISKYIQNDYLEQIKNTGCVEYLTIESKMNRK